MNLLSIFLPPKVAPPQAASGYAALSDANRARWHAKVYAFRRVVQGISDDEHASPCDPEGKFYDPVLIAQAEAALKLRKTRSRSQRDRELEWEGRYLCMCFAEERGYADWDEYLEAGGSYAEMISSQAGPRAVPKS
jgi:hypothetical protein